MGRVKTPTNVLEMRGSFRKHPERKRARKDEPQNLPPLGAVPEALDDVHKAAWRDIVRTVPAGVLTVSDELSVETAARLLVRVRKGDAGAGIFGQLRAFMAAFGLTPSDRVKLIVPKPTKQNRFSRFA
jgi:hypothetical protein